MMSTENNREGGVPHPLAVGSELSSWNNPKHSFPLDPRQALREHKAVLLSPLLELSLVIQRSQGNPQQRVHTQRNKIWKGI